MWLFSESLSSEQGFNNVAMWMDNLIVKLLLWAVISGLLYHLIAGIKHLLMDLGIGETLEGAQTGAKLVVALSVISIVLTGVWLW
jgi:succinate dehydrogenase / fumarate reductase cytochrome b subunit